MSKGFLKDTALKVVGKTGNAVKLPNTKNQVNRLYKDYFSLETGEPISLEQISNRVKRRFSEIERNSVFSVIDLFFIYQNWTGFYSRTDSFTKYIREELKISKTFAYGVIHSVELLNDYFIHKGNLAEDLNGFMEEVTSSIEAIGIKKLIILSGMKSDEKFEYVDRLLDGEKITASMLLNTPVKKQKAKPKQTAVKIDGDELKVGNSAILTFNSKNETIRKAVFKTVERWYLKDLEPKKVK